MSVTETVVESFEETVKGSQFILRKDEIRKEVSGLNATMDINQKDNKASLSGMTRGIQHGGLHMANQYGSGTPFVSGSKMAFASHNLVNAHLSFLTMKKKIDNFAQRRLMKRKIPLLLRAGLLVFCLQTCSLIAILVGSIQPVGMWFLFLCLVSLGYIFCSTTLVDKARSATSNSIESNNSSEKEGLNNKIIFGQIHQSYKKNT